jgi:hypothetical protein
MTAGYIICFVEKKLFDELGGNYKTYFLNHLMGFIRKGLNRCGEQNLVRRDDIKTVINSLGNKCNFITVTT